ncbi:hypothetical protein GCM10023198_55710 [Promicromonospora umidemergens]|uniref:Uncharacterized protein n=1 Tax=Promicromonospora umidemergens TaxID=629679 RepID=A0ABP8YAK3_9MICO
MAGGATCSGEVLWPVAGTGRSTLGVTGADAGAGEAAGGAAGVAGLCGPALGLSALFAAGAVFGGRSNAKTRGV